MNEHPPWVVPLPERLQCQALEQRIHLRARCGNRAEFQYLRMDGTESWYCSKHLYTFVLKADIYQQQENVAEQRRWEAWCHARGAGAVGC